LTAFAAATLAFVAVGLAGADFAADFVAAGEAFLTVDLVAVEFFAAARAFGEEAFVFLSPDFVAVVVAVSDFVTRSAGAASAARTVVAGFSTFVF